MFRQERPARPVEQLGFLGAVDAAHGEEIGDLGNGFAVRRLQTADKVPLDGAREQGGFLREFLGVVLAKVRVREGLLVEREDVVCGLQFGDCYETNLVERVREGRKGRS